MDNALSSEKKLSVSLSSFLPIYIYFFLFLPFALRKRILSKRNDEGPHWIPPLTFSRESMIRSFKDSPGVFPATGEQRPNTPGVIQNTQSADKTGYSVFPKKNKKIRTSAFVIFGLHFWCLWGFDGSGQVNFPFSVILNAIFEKLMIQFWIKNQNFLLSSLSCPCS